MKEIFELQWLLNVHTLKKIGLNYEATIRDSEEKLLWIENYRIALSAELAELIREVAEYGLQTRNGKIEVVDMLHFLVSLSHILNVDPVEVSLWQPTKDESGFNSCVITTFLALDDLQNSLKWKWWAKGGGFKEDKAREAVLNLWHCFWEISALFHLDFHRIKEIYIAKNQVNFRRQEQNYNEDTKSEADNRALSV